MSDFVSSFWSWYVSLLALVAILACVALLRSQRARPAAGAPQLHGHTWDEDLAEYNNPLPRWWMWLFYLTIVFALVYLVLYPGLGTFAGVYGWTSRGEHQAETQQAESQYGPIFNKFAQQDLAVLADSPEARAIGQRLFLVYCSQCHGSDAGGGFGFPDLRDKDWLYGGDPETIKASIMNGRGGVMPPLGAALGEAGVKEVANYVLSLSGATYDAALAAKGKEKFTVCAACHGPDGKGNQAIGAPNLTDNIWLFGGSQKTLMETITQGRVSQMPAHKDLLGEAKVHLLAAYVYSLSLEPGTRAAQKASAQPSPTKK
ncbi:MAG TPA: cytochrome-c oxidase, cbb3-type subunit III [Casimicrobiaceae bacterium]|nr:cytochrome-c oxidase, cbb3-type subunit III [Casimicrobiaceae bacterium]